VCWTAGILQQSEGSPGGRSLEQSSLRKLCLEWRVWDVLSVDHPQQVVSGLSFLTDTFRLVGSYLIITLFVVRLVILIDLYSCLYYCL
jgi:hypothetical protein